MATETIETPAPAPTTDPGSAVPPSTGEIHVVPPPLEPTSAKPGSAMSRMRAELAKRAKPQGPTEPEPATPPVTSAKPDEKPAKDDANVAKDDSKPATDAPPEGAAPASGEKPAKTKVNPWKLVDEYKAKTASLEKELVETKGRILPEADRKALEESRNSMQKRVDELEKEIAFVNYSKSREFQDKYQKPYEEAWNRAMNELKELTIVEGPEGAQTSRAVTPQDLLELVNLPLGKARELANAVFGDFADDVMAHRKEIRNLFDAQNTALEQARTNGAERMKQAMSQIKAAQEQMSKSVMETWTKENEAALAHEKHGKFFKPVEGDEEGNQRLAKGYQLVDRAFAENPMDPRLKPEQRAEIVRRHAAVRHRAAAFGRLVYYNSRLEQRVAELDKELAQYRGSTPSNEGGRVESGTVQPQKAWDSIRSGLQKIAK